MNAPCNSKYLEPRNGALSAMVTKSILYSSLSFLLLLTGQLNAQDNRTQLSRICKIVSYQPEVLSGCGLLLDLRSLESSESLSLSEKLQLIKDIQTSDANSAIEKLQDNVDASQFLHLVTVKVDLTEKGAVAGETLDCGVTSLSGKPVARGFLLPTVVRANDPTNQQEYGTAGGFVSAKDPSVDYGAISKGCRISVDLTQVIINDSDCILLINRKNAGLALASNIARILNQSFFQTEHAAVVLDARHVKFRLPREYSSEVFDFAAEVLELKVYLQTQSPVTQSVAQAPKDQSH